MPPYPDQDRGCGETIVRSDVSEKVRTLFCFIRPFPRYIKVALPGFHCQGVRQNSDGREEKAKSGRFA